MGLLDWLGDALGGSGGGMSPNQPFIQATNDYNGPANGGTPMQPPVTPPPPDGGTPMAPGPGSMVGQLDPMGSPTGQMMPLPTPAPGPTNPMPLPDVGVGMDAPPLYNDAAGLPQKGAPPGLMYPAGGDPMQGTGNEGPGLPPKLAAPPPSPAPAPAPNPAALPPNATSTDGTAVPLNPPPVIGGGPPEARSFIGRALGLDPNTEKVLSGSLGAGLKAAGENSNKGKGAAFMGSAGSAIEGGDKADDKIYEQKDKYLQRAIAAKREGNNAEYHKNYLAYQIAATKEKLAQSKEKAANGGNSVLNSPSQLYLRADALAITANGALKSQYDKTAQQFGADSKEAKAALDAYNKGVAAEREAQYVKHGLDPKKAAEIGKQPGMSDKNPVKDFPKDEAAARKKFDELPEGAYFVNPKDNRVLKKMTTGGSQAPNPAQPGQQSALMPPMPPMPLDPNQEAA